MIAAAPAGAEWDLSRAERSHKVNEARPDPGRDCMLAGL
jgi:hypothetical protein